MMRNQISAMLADPRHGQICALSGLILLGMAVFAFEMPWWRPATAVATALSVQAGLGRLMGWRFDWRSPLITSLSLTLLFRSEGAELVALAAALAIVSKTVLRVDGRHFVNPAAFAIVTLVLLFDGAWVSPGQWGAEGWAVIFAVGAGIAVTHGAHRLEVPLTFLAAWAALSFGRALWLGDPMAIPMHQMASGALVVFAFFMISDPMTAPWHPVARAVWVCLAAMAGFALQISWIVTAGPLFGLLAVCWLVPILNRLFPASQHRWRPSNTQSPFKEQVHA